MIPCHWLLYAFCAGWGAHVLRMHFWFKRVLRPTLDHMRQVVDKPRP